MTVTIGILYALDLILYIRVLIVNFNVFFGRKINICIVILFMSFFRKLNLLTVGR